MAAVFTWGFGKYGQLGNGQTSNAETPQLARLPSGAHPRAVSCGAHFTSIVCRTAGGGTKVFSTGWGKHGRLGTGSEENRNVPAELSIDPSVEVAELSAGHWHACCVGGDGCLYSWGYNKTHGVLGLAGSGPPGAVSKSPPPPPPFESVPRRVFFPGASFRHVSCGYNYSYAVSADGRCYSWGCGKHGVLGHGDTSDRTQPTLIAAVRDLAFKAVSCGHSHAALLECSGTLHTVGSGADGALGQGNDKRDRCTPAVVGALAGVEVTDASCSQGDHHPHSLACTSEGTVFSWGDGYKGKLGHSNQESCDVPRPIDQLHFLNQKVIGVACGGIHSSAVTGEGGVFTWGCGSDGRLGHPEGKGHRYLFRSDVPRLVEGLPKGLAAIAVSCSYYHTAVLCRPLTTPEQS